MNSARAAAYMALQMPSCHQMVVDSSAGYVFLSEGLGSHFVAGGSDPAAALVVTGLRGNYVTGRRAATRVAGPFPAPAGSA